MFSLGLVRPRMGVPATMRGVMMDFSEAAWFNARLDEYLADLDDDGCSDDCEGCDECDPG